MRSERGSLRARSRAILPPRIAAVTRTRPIGPLPNRGLGGDHFECVPAHPGSLARSRAIPRTAHSGEAGQSSAAANERLAGGVAISIQLTGPTTRPDYCIDGVDHALYAEQQTGSMRFERSKTPTGRLTQGSVLARQDAVGSHDAIFARLEVE